MHDLCSTSFRPSVPRSVHMYVRSLKHPNVRPSLQTPECPSIYTFVRLSVRPSVRPFVPANRPSVRRLLRLESGYLQATTISSLTCARPASGSLPIWMSAAGLSPPYTAAAASNEGGFHFTRSPVLRPVSRVRSPRSRSIAMETPAPGLSHPPTFRPRCQLPNHPGRERKKEREKERETDFSNLQPGRSRRRARNARGRTTREKNPINKEKPYIIDDLGLNVDQRGLNCYHVTRIGRHCFVYF